MSTTTKPLVGSMFHELFSLISNLEPWTLFDPAHTDRSSDQTILSSDSPVPEITGLKDITLRVSLPINSRALF